MTRLFGLGPLGVKTNYLAQKIAVGVSSKTEGIVIILSRVGRPILSRVARPVFAYTYKRISGQSRTKPARLENNDGLVASYSTTRAASFRLMHKIQGRNTWRTMTSLGKTILFSLL